jgi:hypothetical protein
LALIYPATAIVFLGVIVVFFMKRPLAKLRKELEARGASTSAQFSHALGAVVEVGAGPTLSGIAVFGGTRPSEAPLGFVTGFLLVVVAPILSVVRWTRRYPAVEASQRTSGMIRRIPRRVVGLRPGPSRRRRRFPKRRSTSVNSSDFRFSTATATSRSTPTPATGSRPSTGENSCRNVRRPAEPRED